MKAMILAAGRGERMRPLTDHVPKPLLEVGGKPLIVHLIESLAQAGFRELVINYAHLGEKIVAALGVGDQFGARIQYSPEGEEGLETGGGIYNALSLLGNEPFLVVNGDIWTDFPFSQLSRRIDDAQAHLILVDNPSHNVKGDFCLKGRQVYMEGGEKLTYSGIGVFKPALFENCQPGKFPLAPLLQSAVSRGEVTGEYYSGQWVDVGTPQRLRQLDRQLLV